MVTLEEYCANFREDKWDDLEASSQEFLQRLDLPTYHPFCVESSPTTDAPAMGSYEGVCLPLWEKLLTFYFSFCVPLSSFASLWVRLLSGYIAPAAIVWLLWRETSMSFSRSRKSQNNTRSISTIWVFLLLLCSFTVAVDSMYVYEYGRWGLVLFALTSFLVLCEAWRYKSPTILYFVIIFTLLTYSLSIPHRTRHYRDQPDYEQVLIKSGLYFDRDNQYINNLVSKWPMENRTYSNTNPFMKPTPWMLTGDARTGLPFFLHSPPQPPWIRVFLRLKDDEVLALDITFPRGGHNNHKPVYLLLTGINGGTTEEFTRDMIFRAANTGSTVVTMVSRGLMDLPVKGWNIFHGARWTDIEEAANVVRKSLLPDQVLAGVGFSMGGIILNNYVASSGKSCALDAAFSISSALDCRQEAKYDRAKRLWETMIASNIRKAQILPKWGQKMIAKLSPKDFVGLLRARDIIELDNFLSVKYGDFSSLEHFYSEMGALGDVPDEVLGGTVDPLGSHRYKIDDIAIPLCLLHSFDDPIGTWTTIVDNRGFMHPNSLVRRGNGNLLLLLTSKGGHVGWPVGYFPWIHGWKFMNEAALTFVDSVDLVLKESRNASE